MDGLRAMDRTWRLLLAVRQAVDAGAEPRDEWGFRRIGEGWARAPVERADCVVDPRAARVRKVPDGPAGDWDELMELHLAHALRARAVGYVLALLGQSLDGFIATSEGHSR